MKIGITAEFKSQLKKDSIMEVINIIIKNVLVSEAEEIMIEQDSFSEEIPIETCCGDDTKIFIDEDYIHIPELSINIHSGVFCNLNDGEWEADFSLYVRGQ